MVRNFSALTESISEASFDQNKMSFYFWTQEEELFLSLTKEKCPISRPKNSYMINLDVTSSLATNKETRLS